MFKQASSSPIKFKQSTNHSSHASRTLDQEREDMVSDLEEIVPEVKMSFFEDHILPPSPLPDRAFLKWVVQRLRDQEKINTSNKWMNWPQPSESDSKEDKIFAKFQYLAEDIVAAASPQIDKAVRINFKCNPFMTLESSTRDNTSKPDCYGILPRAHDRDNVTASDSSWRPKWLDVATPGEFKKDNTIRNFVDDAKKVLWSMNHIMREDPRRSSVIGFTIEDSSMRLWFCSRSDVLMSEAFNMLTNHETFVDFILRMSYATEQQLGWDPTITLREETLSSPGGLQYDIQVIERDESEAKTIISNRTFRTQKIISNFAADALRGRATRVWEVKELDEHGEEIGAPCVLKDSWVDSGRLSEGLILAKIREEAITLRWRKKTAPVVKEAARVAATKVPTEESTQEGSTHAQAEVSTEAPEEASQGRDGAVDAQRQSTEANADDGVLEEYLLTVVTYGYVLVDGVEAQTRPKARGWKAEPDVDHTRVVSVKVKPRPHTATARSSKQAVGAVSIKTKTENDKKPQDKLYAAFANKTHHRIVFKELCEPLHEMTSLCKIFEYLASIASALKYLHELGWVHRDISAGNILIYNGSPKLSDLEYAKHEGDWTVSGIRTGTPYFMAAEVEHNEYSHLTVPPILPPDHISNADLDNLELDLDEYLDDEALGAQFAVPRAANPRIQFRNNPLHDKESLLWLALYCVVCGRLVALRGKADPRLDRFTPNHLKLAVTLFTNKDTRRDIMKTEGALGNHLANASLHPVINGIANLLQSLFDILRFTYQSVEKERLWPIPFTVANGLHSQFAQLFRRASDILRKHDVTIALDDSCYDRMRELYRSQSKSASGALAASGKNSRDHGGQDGSSGLRPLKKQKTEETSDTLPQTTSASHLPSKLRE